MKLRIAFVSLSALAVASAAYAQSFTINTTRANIPRHPPKMMADGSVTIESVASLLPGMIGQSMDSIEQQMSRKMVPITLNETLGGERIFAQSGEFKFVMTFTVSGGDAASIMMPPQGTGEGWGPWKPIPTTLMFKVKDKVVTGVLMSLNGGEMGGPGYFTVLSALTEMKQFNPRQIGVDGQMDAMWAGSAFSLIGHKGLSHWGDRKQVSGDPHEYVNGRAMFSQGSINQIPFMVAGLGCPMMPVGADQRGGTTSGWYFPIRRVFDASSMSAGTNAVLIPSPSVENVTALLPFGGVVAVGDVDYRITKPGMDRFVRGSSAGGGYYAILKVRRGA